MADIQKILSNSGPYIAKDGSLGIGIVAPDDALLHVYDTVNRAGTGNLRLTNTSNTQTVLLLENTTSRKYELAVGGSANSIGNGSFYIYDVDAGASRFEINSSGNATFTGDVTAVQHIATNIFAQNFYVASSGSNAVNRIDNDGSNLYITYGGTTTRALEIVNSNGKAIFKGNVDVVEDLKINPDYNNSNEYLLVRKHQSADGGIILQSKTSGGSTQSDWQIVNHASTGDLKFYAYGLADHALTLDREDGSATFAGNLTVQGATTRLENNVTVGNSSTDYLETRYNDTANYATRLMWRGLQFGNNGVAKIVAGRTAANGFFEFYVNNTNDGLANTPDGNLALTIAANKNATFEGNVGINDTSPSKGKLQIDQESNTLSSIQLVNTAQSSSNFSTYPISIFFGDEQAGSSARHQASINAVREAWSNSPAALTFKTSATVNGATEKMRITSGGNVGIGTTSPPQKLAVIGNISLGNYNGSDFSRSVGINDAAGAYGNGSSYIKFNELSGSGTSGTTKGAAIEFYNHLYAGNTNQTMIIQANGNVGIGTTAPGRKLTVTGDASGDANNLLIANENDTDGDSASIGFSMLSNDTYVKAGIFFKRTTTQGRGDLIFATNDEVNGNNVTLSNARMTIDRSGNVGIGTSSPQSVGAAWTTLEVQGKSTGGGGIIYTANNGATVKSHYYSDGNGGYIGTQTNHYFAFTSNNTERMRLLSSGTLLVGKTSSSISTAGIELNQNGVGNFTRDSVIAQFNRLTTDGNVINILKDGATVGVIGTQNWGIGTASPYTLLELSSTDPIIRMTDSNGVADKSIYEMRAIGASGSESLEFRSVNDANNDYNKLLVLRHGGNVGLGTDQPLRDLHLKKSNSGGQVRAEVFNTSNTANSHGIVSIYSGGASAGDPFLHWKVEGVQDWSMGIDNSDSDKLKISKNFGPGTNDYLSIDTSGNVGIGTTSPASKLDISDGTIYSLKLSNTSAYNSGINNGVVFNGKYNSSGNTTDMASIRGGKDTINDTDFGGKLTFHTRLNGGSDTERARIDQNGNVGIGTTLPNNNANRTTLTLNHATSGGVLAFAVNDSRKALLYTENTTNNLIVQAESGESIKLNTSGSNTALTLDANQLATFAGNVIAEGSLITRSVNANVTISGDTSGNIYYNNASGEHRWRANGSSVNSMSLSSTLLTVNENATFTGSVSITADSQPALSVTGGISCGLDLVIAQNSQLQASRNTTTDSVAAAAVSLIDHNTGSGNRATMTMEANSYQGPKHIEFYLGTTVNGSISSGLNATGFNTSSDYRLKEDLKDFNGLEIASKIKMYDFKWKSDDNARAYGVMAHELQEILPQAVSGDKDEKNENGKAIYQGVDYSKLVPVLVKSIQELETRIKELKAQNEDLLNRVKALESK